MVSQPIMTAIQKVASQNIGLGLKGSLHRTHFSGPSGAGYHQQHHVYHMTDPSGYSHGHSHSEHGGGKKRSIALSALTLLAFLFFLNILQNCIEEQMDDTNNPQFIIMTSRQQQLKEAQTRLADGKSTTDGSINNNERKFEKLQIQKKADHFSEANTFPNVTMQIISKNNRKGRP